MTNSAFDIHLCKDVRVRSPWAYISGMPKRQYRDALRRTYAIDLTVNKQLKPRNMQIITSVVTIDISKSRLFPSLLCRYRKVQCDYKKLFSS